MSLEKKDIYSIAISACALTVSAGALLVSYLINSRDASYKELMIKPALSFRTHDYDTILSLENQGIGPALIKNIVLSNQAECYVSHSSKDWRAEQKKFYSDFENEFSESYFAENRSLAAKGSSYKIIPFRDLISPGEVIPVGKKLDLTRIEVELKGDIPKIFTISEDERLSIKRRVFAEGLKKRSISVEYCSMSGLTCDFIGFNYSRTPSGCALSGLKP